MISEQHMSCIGGVQCTGSRALADGKYLHPSELSLGTNKERDTAGTAYIISSSRPRPTQTTTYTTKMQIPVVQPKLIASIDMGTNSFKLLIVRPNPAGRFLTLDRIKDPVTLGRDTPSDAAASPTISSESQRRAISALRNFESILTRHSVRHFSVVATSAVREAQNQSELLAAIRDDLGFHVNVLSGENEARLIYLGVLQFLPVFDKTILTVDIGGGSTEFALGKEGKVIFAASLKLGHVTLTEGFVKSGKIVNMRKKIQSVISDSGIVEKVKNVGFEVAVGSSGTIRSIAKAASRINAFSRFGGGWRLDREELGVIVEKLCGGEVEIGVSKRRAEFILAGAILLWEIFVFLGIEEMEVSKYALGEGVLAEMLAKELKGYDIGANARWRSVVRLAARFNGEKRMKSAGQSAGVAKEFFEGLTNCHQLTNHQFKCVAHHLGEKDLEYLEAAILLHDIGLIIGKKGYHKQSYLMIKNANNLDGYKPEEVELIALLARFHRKKFPKRDHAALEGLTKEVKLNFRGLCVIMRISLAVQKLKGMMFQRIEISHPHEGYKLVLKEIKDQSPIPDTFVQPTLLDVETELGPELENFHEVFRHRLSVEILPNT